MLSRLLAWGNESGELDEDNIQGLAFLLENARLRISIAREMENGVFQDRGEA